MHRITTPRAPIPTIAKVDVLVVGSTAAAAAAADSARKKGASVYLVSDRSYVGEELTAWFGTLPEADTIGEFGRSILAAAPSGTPMALKHALEKRLLDQNIPFLFHSRPIALLMDESNKLGGVIFASRCAWFAIQAKHVVDASLHGLVAQLGPWVGEKRATAGEALFRALAPISEQTPEGVRRLTVPTQEGGTEEFWVREFRRPLEGSTVPELAALEQKARREFFFPEQGRTADSLQMIAPWRFAGLDETTAALTIAGTAALDESAAEEALKAGGLLAIGEAAGSRAADIAARRTISGSLRLFEKAGAVETVPGLRFGPTPLRWQLNSEAIEIDGVTAEVLAEVDVLVVGGGTGGAPAAIGAARSGAKTLLIEMLPGLGGVGTLGMIGKYWFGNRVGFTAELDAGAASMGPNGKHPASGASWHPEWKMAWYLNEITRAGGAVWFGSFACGVVVEENRVVGVLISTPFGPGLVRAKAVVDATGNSDIPAAAGAPCRSIAADHVAVQGTGLPPRQPLLCYRNTDYTFVDEADVVNVTQSFVTGRVKFAGEFDLAPIIDTRERRQIIGDIELSPLDFLAERTFPDTVMVARSNFDTHGFTIHPVFTALPPSKKPMNARVPFRCLLPAGLEGVLVTGLGMSAHRDALPVIRMQADVQNQGCAAGMAAAMAAAEGKQFRALDIRELQKRLVACGILEEAALTEVDSFPLDDETVRAAVARGPVDHHTIAIILGNPERSVPLLRERLAQPVESHEAENAALLLGLLGEACAASVLLDRVAKSSWDQGWNYTGMGQFGMSLSRLDSLIVALGKTGDLRAVSILIDKIESLSPESEFSHCRALSIAACCLRSQRLAEPLAKALALPEMGGHAWTDLSRVLDGTDADPIETSARNLSLRELSLARGLFQCGDHAGCGKRVLEQYATDLRGHYASHAVAVLKEPVDTSAPAPLEIRLRIA